MKAPEPATKLKLTDVVSIGAEGEPRFTVAVIGPQSVEPGTLSERVLGATAIARDIGESDSDTKLTAIAITVTRMLLLDTIT